LARQISHRLGIHHSAPPGVRRGYHGPLPSYSHLTQSSWAPYYTPDDYWNDA
jgi:hypothetical protein